MLSAINPTPVRHAPQLLSERSMSIRSPSEEDAIDSAFQAYMDSVRSAFRDTTLTAQGRALAYAVVAPGKVGAPGVQVSTFAVDGAQASDIVMIKRVPATAEGPNFLLYIPEEDGPSFHAFTTREDMTVWLKELANDPDRLDTFARHFSQVLAPEQVDRVKRTMTAFAAGDVNAVVGSFAYEKGDIFARLSKDVSQPPPVNGLSKTSLLRIEPDGRATYMGTRADGEKVLFKYDAYGNLHGGSKDGFFFVKNALNSDEPLVRMTQQEYARQVTGTALDNVGANDLNGLYDEFLKQLRNPGHGLGTALAALGVPKDTAHSIEAVMKNPVTGTLLELNQGNRLGRVFGVDKDAMDSALKQAGDAAQRYIPGYGKRRELLSTLADTLESTFGTPAVATVEVNIR